MKSKTPFNPRGGPTIQCRACNDRYDKDQLIMYARAYLLHMFRGLIFMSTTGNTISLFFLTPLDDFWVIPNYSWGGYACIFIPTTL